MTALRNDLPRAHHDPGQMKFVFDQRKTIRIQTAAFATIRTTAGILLSYWADSKQCFPTKTICNSSVLVVALVSGGNSQTNN
jgi:hypothetical protein